MIQVPKVEIAQIEQVKTDPKNPNRMSKTQEAALVEAIKRFGFINPIITNQDFLIADGEHRLQAAKSLEMKEVPIIRIPLKEVDRRTLRQVLNKLKGTHDWILDVEEFSFIQQNGGYDDLKSLIALSEAEENRFLKATGQEAKEDDFDTDAELTNIKKPRIKLGEVWNLGKHKIMCGDATDPHQISTLIGGGEVGLHHN